MKQLEKYEYYAGHPEDLREALWAMQLHLSASMREISKKIGINIGTLSGFLNGKKNPDYIVISKIYKFLDKTHTEIKFLDAKEDAEKERGLAELKDI